MFRNGDTGTFDVADSGDEPGEESAINGDSKVEFVVVGEDSVDTEVMELTLSRWCRGCVAWRRCVESGRGFASVIRIRVSLCNVSGEDNSSISFTMLASGFPKTDMNDGTGVDIIEPISTGMVGQFARKGRLLQDGAVKSGSE